MTINEVVQKINAATKLDLYGRMVFAINKVQFICMDWELYNATLYIYSMDDCSSAYPDATIPISKIDSIGG